MSQEFIEKIFIEPKYLEIVKGTIITMTGKISDSDLDDCVSEVYLIALKNKSSIEKHPDINGWLNLTAKNVAKRFKSNRFIELIYQTDPSDDVADPARFEETLEDEERYKELLTILRESLKSIEYELYELKYVKNHSNEKIAEILKIKRRAVDKRIERLQEKIKHIIEQSNL